jgi:hypothetical protein
MHNLIFNRTGFVRLNENAATIEPTTNYIVRQHRDEPTVGLPGSPLYPYAETPFFLTEAGRITEWHNLHPDSLNAKWGQPVPTRTKTTLRSGTNTAAPQNQMPAFKPNAPQFNTFPDGFGQPLPTVNEDSALQSFADDLPIIVQPQQEINQAN